MVYSQLTLDAKCGLRNCNKHYPSLCSDADPILGAIWGALHILPWDREHAGQSAGVTEETEGKPAYAYRSHHSLLCVRWVFLPSGKQSCVLYGFPVIISYLSKQENLHTLLYLFTIWLYVYAEGSMGTDWSQWQTHFNITIPLLQMPCNGRLST